MRPDPAAVAITAESAGIALVTVVARLLWHLFFDTRNDALMAVGVIFFGVIVGA